MKAGQIKIVKCHNSAGGSGTQAFFEKCLPVTVTI
jgi:hypothetical protein